MSKAIQQLESLSPAKIDASADIRDWLSQFPEGQRSLAKLLLSRLRFVSRDTYAAWLRGAVASLPADQVHALYSVRKLDDDQACYWNEDGEPVTRPGSSLGSEDLVYSLISNQVRSSAGRLLDHPPLLELKNKKVRSYVLIDDSIGSGDRVAGFINAMLHHPTFLSWWSFGWVKIHVLSFARPRESEARIIAKVRGSDHGKRKFKKSSKIDFSSEVVYQRDWLEARWGENYDQLVAFCRGQKKVPNWARLGYGEVLANIVFYHSVPNNLPGTLWFSNEKWQGLMPGRALPDWLLTLLNSQVASATPGNGIADELLKLLALVKRGVRSAHSIALRLNVDHRYALELLHQAETLGLVTPQVRLTATGLDRLLQSMKSIALPEWDHSLYIPSSWCAGRATVQPSMQSEPTPSALADSVEVLAFTDGDVGQTSLERSDAKAAAPPFSVMLQSPAVSRENHDTDGPLGSKER
jgi:hypothetical protein